MRTITLSVVLGLMASGPMASPAFSQPQRDAVSSTLSPEAAAAVFDDAVITACIPAVAGSGIPVAARGKLQATSDAATRRQSGASSDEAVWDVLAGKGVVTIHEKPGRCVVSVYGPPAIATISTLANLLANSNFERLVNTTQSAGFGQTLTRTDGGKRMMIVLTGSDPGMPGHQSQFSVIRATVFSAP
jgi:hypothetical protein